MRAHAQTRALPTPTLAKRTAKSNHFTEYWQMSRLYLISPACSASEFLFMFVYFGLSFSYLFTCWLQDQTPPPKATVCCTMARWHWVFSSKLYFNKCHKQWKRQHKHIGTRCTSRKNRERRASCHRINPFSVTWPSLEASGQHRTSLQWERN